MLVEGEQLAIGGHGDCDVVLTDSQVEDRHLLIVLRGDQLHLRDLVTGATLAIGLDASYVIGETEIELERAAIVPDKLGEPWPAVLSATERGLLAKLANNPSDEEARAIYGDWLEANGHKLRAAFVRRPPDEDTTPNTSELFGVIVKYTDFEWRCIVGRSSIDECAHYGCPGRWHLLDATERYDSRVCVECDVTLAYSDWAIRKRAPTNRR